MGEKRVTGRDVQRLRELLGVSSVDLFYLLGRAPSGGTVRLEGPRSELPISTPGVSLLARYLDRYPEANFLPRFPDYQETFDGVRDAYEDLVGAPLTARRLSLICGAGASAGYQWASGAPPVPYFQRLFHLLLEATREEGTDGLERFLEVVDEEARARGIQGGVGELIRRSNNHWNRDEEATLVHQDSPPPKKKASIKEKAAKKKSVKKKGATRSRAAPGRRKGGA